ncbi:MAG TPA: hypothetical protein PLB81_03645 [Deltaproteobacteria bacterium]|nr:hypothetical protein [Deltaproteobacteria bacterium]
MEPKIYSLNVSLFLKILMVSILILFTGVGVFLLWYTSVNTGNSVPPPLLAVAWLIAMVMPWIWLLTVPYRIRVDDLGAIELTSLVRTRTLNPADIVSIGPDATQLGFLILKHRKGKIRLVHQFDNFHEFLSNLKSVNPDIMLRGC